MGEIKSALRATLEQFHAFRDERPRREKWELIDGVMTLTPQPTLVHQRIAGNIERALNGRLGRNELPWSADLGICLLLPDDDKYNPEPDVTVIDTDIDLGQIYAERFYFVAEVLSPNDKSWVLSLKREYYKAHEHCRTVMLVRQDRIEAELIVREGLGWRELQLDAAADIITIPDIGEIGTLGALYRFTPLQPAA